jgi:hypothetical protein
MSLTPGRSIQLSGDYRLPSYAKQYARTWATIVDSVTDPSCADHQHNLLYLCRMQDSSIHPLPISAFTLVIQARIIPEDGNAEKDSIIARSEEEEEEEEDEEEEEAYDPDGHTTEAISDVSTPSFSASSPSQSQFMRPPCFRLASKKHRSKRSRTKFDKGDCVCVTDHAGAIGQIFDGAHGYFSVEFQDGSTRCFRSSQLQAVS